MKNYILIAHLTIRLDTVGLSEPCAVLAWSLTVNLRCILLNTTPLKQF